MKNTDWIDPKDPDERYRVLYAQMEALLGGEEDPVANLANAAALLNGALPNINWVGFYRMKDGGLVLGPFQGKPACLRIAVGRGVCGTAVQTGKTQLVPDVNRFPGHIACDAESASELAIPFRSGEKTVGVLDIDSPIPDRFTDPDARALEKIAELIGRSCRWTE